MARGRSTAVRIAEDQSIVIEKLLSEVQKALLDVQARLKDSSFPELESVVLTVRTALAFSGTAKISYVVLSLGVGVQAEKVQELVLTLTPPPRDSAVRTQSIANQLADAIVEAAKGVRNAQGGKPPLRLQSLKASISFALTVEISGSVKVPKITPITLELSASLKDTALHKIEITFKNK